MFVIELLLGISKDMHYLYMDRSEISRGRFLTMFRSEPTTLSDAIVRKPESWCRSCLPIVTTGIPAVNQLLLHLRLLIGVGTYVNDIWLEAEFQQEGFKLYFEANRPPYRTLSSGNRTLVDKNGKKSTFFSRFSRY